MIKIYDKNIIKLKYVMFCVIITLSFSLTAEAKFEAAQIATKVHDIHYDIHGTNVFDGTILSEDITTLSEDITGENIKDDIDNYFIDEGEPYKPFAIKMVLVFYETKPMSLPLVQDYINGAPINETLTTQQAQKILLLGVVKRHKGRGLGLVKK